MQFYNKQSELTFNLVSFYCALWKEMCPTSIVQGNVELCIRILVVLAMDLVSDTFIVLAHLLRSLTKIVK